MGRGSRRRLLTLRRCCRKLWLQILPELENMCLFQASNLPATRLVGNGTLIVQHPWEQHRCCMVFRWDSTTQSPLRTLTSPIALAWPQMTSSISYPFP